MPVEEVEAVEAAEQASVAVEAAEAGALPHGWVAVDDQDGGGRDGNGRMYYWHEATNETRRERPVSRPGAAEAGGGAVLCANLHSSTLDRPKPKLRRPSLRRANVQGEEAHGQVGQAFNLRL